MSLNLLTLTEVNKEQVRNQKSQCQKGDRKFPTLFPVPQTLLESLNAP